MTDAEEWRSVPGYEGLYEVSSLGRVRSLDHEVSTYNGGSYIMPGKLLRQNPTYQGYLQVKLYQRGKPRVRYVHQLVAECFIPNPDHFPIVRHWDDVKDHNTVMNLRWGTSSDNQQDSTRNGNQRNGRESRTHCPQNHEYTEENTYRRPNGHRICRTCAIDRSKRNYHARRAEPSHTLS